MEPVVREMHTKSGLLAAIEASTLYPRRGRAPDPRVHQGPRAGQGNGAAVRQLHRHRPPLSGRPAARHRELAPLPVRRRLHREGAVPALVPRRPRQGAGKEDHPPGPRRRARVGGRARLLPRSRSSCRRPPSRRRCPSPPRRERAARRRCTRHGGTTTTHHEEKGPRHGPAHARPDRHAGVPAVPRGHDVRRVGQPRPRRLRPHRPRRPRRRHQFHRHRRCLLGG